MVESISVEELAKHGITVNSEKDVFYLTFPEGITKNDFARIKEDVQQFHAKQGIYSPISRDEELRLGLNSQQAWDVSWNNTTTFIEDYEGKPAIGVSKQAHLTPTFLNAFVQSYNFIAAEKVAEKEPEKAIGYLLQAMDTGVGSVERDFGGMTGVNPHQIRDKKINTSDISLIFPSTGGGMLASTHWTNDQLNNLKAVIERLDKQEGISREDIDIAVKIAKGQGLEITDFAQVKLREIINAKPKDNEITK